MEVWKDIKGFEGLYQISNCGMVKRLSSLTKARNGIEMRISEKLIQGYLTKEGYVRIELRKDSIRSRIFAHRLVAIHFLENPNQYPQVNHKNCDKQNNHVDNLEWCNNSQNQLHAYANGLNSSYHLSGERSRFAKLKLRDVKIIILLLSKGIKSTCIAGIFRITLASISDIKNNKTWTTHTLEMKAGRVNG